MIDPLTIFFCLFPPLSGSHNSFPPRESLALLRAYRIDEASLLFVKEDAIPLSSSFKKSPPTFSYKSCVLSLEIMDRNTQKSSDFCALLFWHPHDARASGTAFSTPSASKPKPLLIPCIFSIHVVLFLVTHSPCARKGDRVPFSCVTWVTMVPSFLLSLKGKGSSIPSQPRGHAPQDHIFFCFMHFQKDKKSKRCLNVLRKKIRELFPLVAERKEFLIKRELVYGKMYDSFLCRSHVLLHDIFGGMSKDEIECNLFWSH